MRSGYIFLALLFLLFTMFSAMAERDLLAFGLLIAAGFSIHASAVCNADRL